MPEKMINKLVYFETFIQVIFYLLTQTADQEKASIPATSLLMRSAGKIRRIILYYGLGAFQISEINN